jgi:hypothetical protein
MKLILTVFGLAALLVVVWAVLWILATRKKD